MKLYLLQVSDSVPYEASWDVTVSITTNKAIADEWEKTGLGFYQEMELNKSISKNDIPLPRPKGYTKKLDIMNSLLKDDRKLIAEGLE